MSAWAFAGLGHVLQRMCFGKYMRAVCVMWYRGVYCFAFVLVCFRLELEEKFVANCRAGFWLSLPFRFSG